MAGDPPALEMLEGAEEDDILVISDRTGKYRRDQGA